MNKENIKNKDHLEIKHIRNNSEQHLLYITELPSMIFRIMALESQYSVNREHIKQRAEYIKKMVNKLADLAVEFYCTEQGDY